MFSLDWTHSNFSFVLDSVLEAAFVRFETTPIVLVLQTFFSWCPLALVSNALPVLATVLRLALYMHLLVMGVLLFSGSSEAHILSLCCLSDAENMMDNFWIFVTINLYLEFLRGYFVTLLCCRRCPWVFGLASSFALLSHGALKSFLLPSFLLLECFDKTFIWRTVLNIKYGFIALPNGQKILHVLETFHNAKIKNKRLVLWSETVPGHIYRGCVCVRERELPYWWTYIPNKSSWKEY